MSNNISTSTSGTSEKRNPLFAFDVRIFLYSDCSQVLHFINSLPVSYSRVINVYDGNWFRIGLYFNGKKHSSYRFGADYLSGGERNFSLHNLASVYQAPILYSLLEANADELKENIESLKLDDKTGFPATLHIIVYEPEDATKLKMLKTTLGIE